MAYKKFLIELGILVSWLTIISVLIGVYNNFAASSHGPLYVAILVLVDLGGLVLFVFFYKIILSAAD